MSSIGKVLENRFRLFREVGQGGMSTVYIAKDLKIDKEWAVKEITSSEESKFKIDLMTEANLMKRLDHPNLPRIVDIIQEEDKIYIVMDYVEGEALNVLLRRDGPFGYEKVSRWMEQALEALEYLHSQSPPIIYRDMKPGNLMLKPDGNITIIDFGIARERKTDFERDTTILGTKGYAPPEQYQGKSDKRSDIYALGMTMYHLLIGHGPNGNDVFTNQKFKSIEEENLYSVIEKCIRLNPEDRYQSCEEALSALLNPKDNLEKTKKPLRLRKNLMIVGLSLAITSFLIGGWCKIQSVRLGEEAYEKLVEVPDTVDVEERRAGLIKAIRQSPEKARAYEVLLDTYYEGFGKTESNQLSAILSTFGDKLKSLEDLKNIQYKAGLLYFHEYKTGESASFGERVRKAYPMFEAICNSQAEDWEYEQVSKCYLMICSFYKEYVLTSARAKEASTLEYLDLIHSLKCTIESSTQLEEYDRLALLNAGFMLLFDQRQGLSNKGIGFPLVNDVLSLIESETSKITVSRQRAEKLKQEILGNMSEYRSAIERAFGEKG